MRSRAGRTKARKVTITATGLPGRPNRTRRGSPLSMRPTAIGRPGRIAMRQNATSPSRSITALVWSASPTLTPPLVMIASASAAARKGSFERSRLVAHHAEVDHLDSPAVEQAEDV